MTQSVKLCASICVFYEKIIIFQVVSVCLEAKKLFSLNEKVILTFFKGLFYLICVLNSHVLRYELKVHSFQRS